MDLILKRNYNEKLKLSFSTLQIIALTDNPNLKKVARPNINA